MAELKRIRKKGKKLTSLQEARNVEKVLGDLPDLDHAVRLITFTEFSAVGILRWITEKTTVRWLGVVTFRVGPRCLHYLADAGRTGKIRDASFILGWLSQSHHGPARELAEKLEAIAARHGWDIRYARNHAKVLLFDTEAGFFVVETSSNLNDLPNWESFTVEQDRDLFAWYKALFFGDGTQLPTGQVRGRFTREPGRDMWTGAAGETAAESGSEDPEGTGAACAPDNQTKEAATWQTRSSPSRSLRPGERSTSLKPRSRSDAPPR